jgi:hypothetical protein
MNSDNAVSEVFKMDVSLWKQYFNPLICSHIYRVEDYF